MTASLPQRARMARAQWADEIKADPSLAARQPYNLIGSAAEYRYTDGKIVRDAQLLGSLDMGPGKPEHIFAQTGRLPVFAGGNADVDIEMLEAAAFALLVKHDDDEREFAYTNGAERSLARAKELGWTIVSMKHDWTTIFGKSEAE
jgi:hypothetical protein